jgi:hypothetical protein
MKKLIYNAPTMRLHRLLPHPILAASGENTREITFTTEAEERWENTDELGIGDP